MSRRRATAPVRGVPAAAWFYNQSFTSANRTPAPPAQTERERFEARRSQILSRMDHSPDFVSAYWTARTDRDHCRARLAEGARRRGATLHFHAVSL